MKSLYLSLFFAALLSIAIPAGANVQPTHNLTIALTAASPAPAFGTATTGVSDTQVAKAKKGKKAKKQAKKSA